MNLIQVPDPENLKEVQAICDLNSPFKFGADHPAHFTAAMKEITAWHAGRSPFYKSFLKSRNFNIETIVTLKDCAQIPFIPANFFKSHELVSVPREEIAMHFTSSGTTGQKSQMFFDNWSLKSGQRMVDFMFESFGWVTPEVPVNYLLYTYETEPDSRLGTAYTDNFLCKYAPIHESFLAIRRTGTGGHDFDVFGCIEKLKNYEAQGIPVRIFGFPSFLYFTLTRMRDLGISNLNLSPDSLIILGGGWKGHADKAVPKEELYNRVTEQLGIQGSRVRDSFGAVEHGIPYTECERHQFHVPTWSHVIIRDVRTLKPRAFGEKGFLQFLTPFITSVPAHSLLMGDLASLHPGKDCGCGITSPYFVIHGRAGTSKNRSCAIAASEMLGR